MSTGRARFEIIVTGKGSDHRGTRQRIGVAATEEAAFRRAIEVLLQWRDSHGAVQPGTMVSIVDLADGGKLFQAEYLGYEPQTLIGR